MSGATWIVGGLFILATAIGLSHHGSGMVVSIATIGFFILFVAQGVTVAITKAIREKK